MPIDPRLNEISDSLYRIAAKALIVNNKQLLVTKELDDEWWSLPGGGIEHGEDISQALKREIEEEIGIPQNEIESTWQMAFASIGGVVDGIPRANLYYNVSIPASKVKKTSHIVDYKWVNAGELSKLYLSPSVEGALSQIRRALND